MDVAFVIRQRLAELDYEQRDLARAAAVTESYISQLLTRKKAPPAPNRTDIYDKMETFLQLPRGELAKLADLQRQEELQRKLRERSGYMGHSIFNSLPRRTTSRSSNAISGHREAFLLCRKY